MKQSNFAHSLKYGNCFMKSDKSRGLSAKESFSDLVEEELIK